MAAPHDLRIDIRGLFESDYSPSNITLHRLEIVETGQVAMSATWSSVGGLEIILQHPHISLHQKGRISIKNYDHDKLELLSYTGSRMEKRFNFPTSLNDETISSIWPNGLENLIQMVLVVEKQLEHETFLRQKELGPGNYYQPQLLGWLLRKSGIKVLKPAQAAA